MTEFMFKTRKLIGVPAKCGKCTIRTTSFTAASMSCSYDRSSPPVQALS